MQPAQGITPTVIIGLGGTGKDVIARMRRLVVERFGSLDKLPIVAFMSIDTDDAPAGVPERVLGQDISLTHGEKVVLDSVGLGPILGNLAQYEHLASWVPPELAGVQDLTSGAKQIRALGRLAFFMGYADVKEAIQAAAKRVTDRDHARKLADEYGISVGNGVDVVIVSSLCGGTGSGMLLDLAYNVRKWFRYDGIINEVGSYLLLPGAFTGVSDRVKANGYACLKELNHHMGLGRSEAVHFTARYSHSSLDELDEQGPPFDFCYLVGDQNKAIDAARLGDLQEMIAQKLALEVTGPFARFARSNRSNLEGVWQVTPRDPFGQPQNYLAFGLATLRFPADRVANALGARLAQTLVSGWRRADAAGNQADFERFLAKNKWLEKPEKPFFGDALRMASEGGTLTEVVERWSDQVRQTVFERTSNLTTELTEIDHSLWDAHREMREKTRGSGHDPKQWGELARVVYDNMKKLRENTEAGLAKAIAEACDDPARGPRHALWLLDELRTTFEHYREEYLGLAKHVMATAPKEKDLKQQLARFDPLAETLWLKLTMQLKGRLEHELDAFLAKLRLFHLAMLEDKVRESGAWMFGKLLETVASQRARVEQLDRQLVMMAGELRGTEKEIIAEILGLNFAHTLYLFDAGDVEAFYSERFGEPAAEQAALSALSHQLLAPGGGKLINLPDLTREDDRHAFLVTIIEAASKLFNEGEHALTRISVSERFVTKYTDRKKQEAVLKDLSNHANPFIHVDGKQAAHKFTLTPVQKVVGLAEADSSKPPRAVQDLLAALGAACQVAPGQIKPNPDPHALIMIQEFGAFPLRIIKGLEGYKACYAHYLDRHLHITKHREVFGDLFPPDEAKAAEALKALTLGLALGLAGVDPTDGATVVYRFQDQTGLADEVTLGSDEHAGVAALVDHDVARYCLLHSVDDMGKKAAGAAGRRALYDSLVRYARAMETKLGARHPRYQAQKAILGDYIRTYLAGAHGEPAAQTKPASDAVSAPHAAQVEALASTYWVDRVVDAPTTASAAGQHISP